MVAQDEQNEQDAAFPQFPGGSADDYQAWMADLTPEQRDQWMRMNQDLLDESRRQKEAADEAERVRLLARPLRSRQRTSGRRGSETPSPLQSQIKTLLDVPAHWALMRELLADREGLERPIAAKRAAPLRLPAFPLTPSPVRTAAASSSQQAESSRAGAGRNRVDEADLLARIASLEAFQVRGGTTKATAILTSPIRHSKRVQQQLEDEEEEEIEDESMEGTPRKRRRASWTPILPEDFVFPLSRPALWSDNRWKNAKACEALYLHPRSAIMVNNDGCYHCTSDASRPPLEEDAYMAAMNERYDECLVIPGEKGKCLRCIWRNGKHCEYVHKPFVARREPKPTSAQLKAAARSKK